MRQARPPGQYHGRIDGRIISAILFYFSTFGIDQRTRHAIINSRRRAARYWKHTGYPAGTTRKAAGSEIVSQQTYCGLEITVNTCSVELAEALGRVFAEFYREELQP